MCYVGLWVELILIETGCRKHVKYLMNYNYLYWIQHFQCMWTYACMLTQRLINFNSQYSKW